MPASKISDLNGWDEFKDPSVVDWKSVRRLIEHEDLLVNQRITWLLSSQSFLLALVGALMGFMGNVCAGKEDWKQFCYVLSGDLLLLPPLIGLVTSSFAAITISQAERQSRVVTEWWHTHYPHGSYFHPPAFPRRPDRKNLFACWFRYSMLASIFAAAWAGLIFAMLHAQWTSSELIKAKPGFVLFYVLQMVLAVPYVYLAFGFGEVCSSRDEASPEKDGAPPGVDEVSPGSDEACPDRDKEKSQCQQEAAVSGETSNDANGSKAGLSRRILESIPESLKQSPRDALNAQVSHLRRMHKSGRLWIGLTLPVIFLSKALFDPALRSLFPGSVCIALATILFAMRAYAISRGQRSIDRNEEQEILANKKIL